MEIKAVFFDVGGTLETFRYTPAYRMQHVPLFRECLGKAGIRLELSDEQLYATLAEGVAAYQRWNRPACIELPTAVIWSRYVFKDAGLTEQQLAPIAEELAFLYETRFYQREMRPEIPEVFARIREMGLAIGCISNTQSRTQVPHTLRRYGLYEACSPIVLSSEFGQRKPDASIFYHAARLACLPTQSIVFVGDKINRDVLGAYRAGYRLKVKIEHPYDDREPDEGATPDAVIQNMTELLPLLEADRRRFYAGARPENPCKIKGLFFDAGNILYHRPRKGQRLRRFLARHKLKACADLRAEKAKLKDLAFQGAIDRLQFYEGVIRLYGVSDPVLLAEGTQAMVQDATTVEILPGVPETLRALKQQGFILGIITDTATPIQVKLDWFERAGFGHLWDSVISSKELGTRKPAALIYEEAFRRVGLSVDEAVFVGHKASELKGARGVGMKTIAFNYDKNARADYYLEKFEDLMKVPILREGTAK